MPIPAGLKATPLVGPDVLALAYRGKTIDQVAAFSASKGEWSTVKLSKPIDGSIAPVVGPGSALYQAGNDFYAFSAEAGAWGALHLPAEESAKPQAATSTKYITVQHGNRLYVFSLKLGKWTDGADMKLPKASSRQGQDVPKPSESR